MSPYQGIEHDPVRDPPVTRRRPGSRPGLTLLTFDRWRGQARIVNAGPSCYYSATAGGFSSADIVRWALHRTLCFHVFLIPGAVDVRFRIVVI